MFLLRWFSPCLYIVVLQEYVVLQGVRRIVSDVFFMDVSTLALTAGCWISEKLIYRISQG